MQCTRSQLCTGILAAALLVAWPQASFGQATPAPVGEPGQILPPDNDNTNANVDEGGTNRRNRCVGIDCLRFGEKEELYWLCSTLAQQGFQVDDKALCTAIGNWKAAQLGGQ